MSNSGLIRVPQECNQQMRAIEMDLEITQRRWREDVCDRGAFPRRFRVSSAVDSQGGVDAADMWWDASGASTVATARSG
jgi:hypothetical protein